MNKEEAKQKIQELIDKYENLKAEGKIKLYNEAQTRNEFIEPLFEYLGWDMRNIKNNNEVTTEENVSGGRVDLAFRIGNYPVFFLEAKAMKADLNDPRWAEQAIRYSWNKNVTWAILTDFESIKVFNAEIPPKNINDNLFFEIPYSDYIKRFDQLWLLSKEAFENNLLEKEAQNWGKITIRKQVDEKLFEDLKNWRIILTKDFKKLNNINDDIVDEGVQRILDRLIFIRTAEDRKIEPVILKNIYTNNKPNKYKQLVKIFREFDEGYDSKLFEQHNCETWIASDDKIIKVISGLYDTEDGFRYDFSIISADVLGGIYEQYLSYVQGRKSEEKSKSKRKSQGIYYTPKFIVDFIVDKTLGDFLKNEKIKNIHNIKILDPACGSGSFLNSAYDIILNSIKQPDLFTKFDILKENIYGVDLDQQAIEIAQLNLLLKVLTQKTKLPTLQHNLICGNSLIDDDPEILIKYFDKDYYDLKPINFRDKFPEVFNTNSKTGFDIIVGNPPYGAELSKEQQKYFNEIYNIGSTNTAILFIKRAMDLLKDDGKLGFIVPKSLCFASNWRNIREVIWDNLEILVDCSKAWQDVKLEQVVFILNKGKKTDAYISGKFENGIFKNLGNINKNDAKEFGLLLNGVSDYEVQIAKKIKNKSIFLNEIGINRIGGDLQKYIVDVGDYEVIGGAQIQRYGIVGIKGKINKNKIKNNNAFIKNNSVLVQNIVAHIENPIDHIKITACIPDKNDYIIVNTINQIIINEKIDRKIIWYLLNSKLINWYAYRFIFGKAIRTMHFDNPVTSRIPIPKDIVKLQETLAKPIDDYLALIKEFYNTPTHTNKWYDLKEKIEKLEKKIDNEIYKYYDLTDDEIKIVEETS
jgi:predicted type IV restriction endonuclease